MLNTQGYPAAAPQGHPPLVIVHGLFGSARNWAGMARRLSALRDVVVPDLRNHGDSPHQAAHGYADLARDLAQVVAAQGGTADILGHSMGGKAAMMLALTQPARVRRLIVADIAPVAYGHDQSRHIAAMRALPLDGLTTRAEADRRMAATTPDPALRAFLLQSLDLKAEGGPRWRLNLDALDAAMPQILGWPDPPGRFDGAALFLSGADSAYVGPQHRAAILALFPAARFARISGAGHWLHADQPRAFADAVEAFLAGA